MGRPTTESVLTFAEMELFIRHTAFNLVTTSVAQAIKYSGPYAGPVTVFVPGETFFR